MNGRHTPDQINREFNRIPEYVRKKKETENRLVRRNVSYEARNFQDRRKGKRQTTVENRNLERRRTSEPKE